MIGRSDLLRLLDGFDASQKQVALLTENVSALKQEIYGLEESVKKQANAAQIVKIDTNLANEQPVNFYTLFGGHPAMSLKVLSVGGAGSTFKIKIGGDSDYATYSAGDTVFLDEFVPQIWILVGTPGAGTAILRATAHVGPLRRK